MEIIEITEEQFESFAKESSNRSFFQTTKIAYLRKTNGFEVKYLGLFDKELKAAAMISISNKKIGKEYYIPRGPLIKNNDIDSLYKFIELITDYGKKNNAIVIRIDPYLEKHKLDILGNVLQEENNYDLISKIEMLGFKLVKEEEQTSYMFALDLKDKSKEQVYNHFSPKTKKNINDAIKFGVKTRILTYDELNIFSDILDETGKRRKFVNRDLEYYQKMYNLFQDEVKFVVAYIEPKKTIESLNKNKEEELDKLSKIENKFSNEGKIKEQKKIIESIENKIEFFDNYKDKELINISASMFVLYGNEAVYLSSGNVKEFLQFGGQYLIQSIMIDYAIDNQFHRYNFYGINRNLDPQNPNYGIYHFKKGFNGVIVELIGEYKKALSYKYFLYSTFTILRKVAGYYKNWYRK